jgi:hypothetical protein
MDSLYPDVVDTHWLPVLYWAGSVNEDDYASPERTYGDIYQPYKQQPDPIH